MGAMRPFFVRKGLSPSPPFGAKEDKFMLKNAVKREWKEFCTLIKCVPSVVVVLFVMSIFTMNLLANKSINLPFDWLALDCGFIVSWFAFFTMDIVTKRFGPKAANELSILATAINLFFCLLLFIGSAIPGTWGESYVEGSEGVIGVALDNTFGGTWYVVLGSTAAFIISALINNFTNYGVGKLFKKNPDCLGAFIARTYVSTAVGQFADNITFAFLVSHFFFGWSALQCVTCALTGMVAELLCEFVFFYPAYRITDGWKKADIGAEYLELRAGRLKVGEKEENNESVDNGNV